MQWDKKGLFLALMCMLWLVLFNHLPLSSKNKSDSFWHVYAYEITLVADFKKEPVKKNELHAVDSQRISMMYLF